MSDTLGDRMKMYEGLQSPRLMPRVPLLIRVDGKAFHTFTRHMDRPWDRRLVRAMQDTARGLCEQIPGATMGYVQSDEVSILVTDWKKYNTQGWFDYKLQKVVSVAASIATAAFNYSMDMAEAGAAIVEGRDYAPPLCKRLALFDARAWSLPRHEVNNYFLWRQQDATRNSVQMLARAHFSHTQCHSKNNSELQDMLVRERNINWNDTPTHLKRGACVIKTEKGWEIDKEIPIFSRDWTYVESRLPKLFGGEQCELV